uniref:TRPM SLOG domain-containing protein n=1 Tax=Magallana gigas TaxID=29159 RepID=A0A8W8NU11_MAGGI
MTSAPKECQCNQDVSEEKNLWDKILEGVNLPPNESGNDEGEAKGTVQSSPTMVFSVIGDSDSFVPRPWPKTVFQTALIEAAKSGGETWILYSGAEQGVSKVVRDAYKYYEDMEFKTKRVEKEISDPDRHVKLISMAGNKTNNSATQKGKSFIEVKPMRPTVFKTTSGKGDNFLLKFEKFISEQTVAFFSQKLDARMPVPVAIIVCEGDIDTIAHIAKALERKLPVIIMKGSGTAADVVIDYLENEDLLPKKASILLGIQFDDTKYQELKTHLEKIRTARNLVGIFDLDRDDPLTLSNIVGDTVVSCWSIENILETIKHGSMLLSLE